MLAKKCCQNKQQRIKISLTRKIYQMKYTYKMLNVQDGRTEGNDTLKNLKKKCERRKQSKDTTWSMTISKKIKTEGSRGVFTA